MINTSTYKTLFEDFRFNRRSLRYPTIFFLRRYVVLLVLTLFPFNELAQIHIHMTSTMYVIAFVSAERPYKNNLINKQEFMNEMMVWIAAYPLLVFTTWI